ncbi:MAG TPA: Bax inhibitor-1 family protein [Rubrobacteraceae bacterium]|nr:Bax inhibitor-1 family protein [Rubrobacteraceae bacterium]
MPQQASEGEGAMNYDVYAGSAAYALPDARAQFIRRTYAHLALAILGFLVIEYALLQVPGIERIGALMTEGFNWLIVLALFIGVSWIADYWARSDTSRGLQYAGLTLYVAAQAIIFLPLMVLAVLISNDPTVVPAAGLITLLLFAGLTVVAFTTRADFSFLRTILVIGGFVALGLIVASMIFGFQLGVIFAVAMVGLAAGFILYTTSNIIHYYRTDQYVAASLSLFAAVALMFYYVLWILLSLRR